VALSGHYFLHRSVRGKPFLKLESSHPSLIEILIPAHDEAELIRETINSIQQSIQSLQSDSEVLPAPKIIVHVGTDGCTDKTASVARQFTGVSVTEFPEKSGKWATLKALINESFADWVILVDAGTIWPESFLSDVLHRIDSREKNVMAIAPSYRLLKAGWLHRILWRLETGLKQMEAFCGGPISLHGATVAYQTPLLKKALTSLGDTLWVNDDVVIPLTLRALDPEGVILYPVGEVRDAGVQQHQLDLGRRRRLLLGNLQWVRTLLPPCIRRNPVAAVVAGRRLFRVLWAYWIAMIVFGLALAFHFVVLPAAAAIGVLMVTSGSFRQFSGAALVSLLAPVLIIQANRQPLGDWK
jgi:glycosyltransferase involved in cell wall biosynthesis